MPDIHGNPIRIMRPRRKGAKLPEGSRYVGKPTIFCNPFEIPRIGHMKAVLMYREWINHNLGALFLERSGFSPAEIDAIGRLRGVALTSLHRLHGCDLVCWCPLTSHCHADELLRLVPIYAEIERLAA